MLKDDGGYYPELMDAVKLKLESLQPQNVANVVCKDEVIGDLKSWITDTNHYEKSNTIDYKKLSEKERFKGNDYIKSQEWDLAIAHYAKAIEHNPSCKFSLANLGFAYMKKKNWGLALDNLNKAILLDKDYLKAIGRRAEVYHTTKSWAEAVDDYEFCLEREPNNKTFIEKLKDSRKQMITDTSNLQTKEQTKMKKVLIEEDSSEGEDVEFEETKENVQQNTKKQEDEMPKLVEEVSTPSHSKSNTVANKTMETLDKTEQDLNKLKQEMRGSMPQSSSSSLNIMSIRTMVSDLNVEMAKLHFSYSAEKDKALEWIRKGDYTKAINALKLLIRNINSENLDVPHELGDLHNQFMLKLYSNLSLAFYKMADYKNCLNYTQKALNQFDFPSLIYEDRLGMRALVTDCSKIRFKLYARVSNVYESLEKYDLAYQILIRMRDKNIMYDKLFSDIRRVEKHVENSKIEFNDFDIYKSKPLHEEWLNADSVSKVVDSLNLSQGKVDLQTQALSEEQTEATQKQQQKKEKVQGQMVSSSMGVGVELEKGVEQQMRSHLGHDEVDQKHGHESKERQSKSYEKETSSNADSSSSSNVMHNLANQDQDQSPILQISNPNTTNTNTPKDPKENKSTIIETSSSTHSKLKEPVPKKPVDQMNIAEKIEYSKDLGNFYYVQDDFDNSIQSYAKYIFEGENLIAGRAPNNALNNNEEYKSKVKNLISQTYSNIALLFLKYSLNNDCILYCKKSLEKNMDNPKAYYRLAQAQCNVNDFVSATLNMKKVIELEPKNTQAVIKYAEIKEKLEKQMSLNKNSTMKTKKKKDKQIKRRISFSDTQHEQTVEEYQTILEVERERSKEKDINISSGGIGGIGGLQCVDIIEDSKVEEVMVEKSDKNENVTKKKVSQFEPMFNDSFKVEKIGESNGLDIKQSKYNETKNAKIKETLNEKAKQENKTEQEHKAEKEVTPTKPTKPKTIKETVMEPTAKSVSESKKEPKLETKVEAKGKKVMINKTLVKPKNIIGFSTELSACKNDTQKSWDYLKLNSQEEVATLLENKDLEADQIVRVYKAMKDHGNTDIPFSVQLIKSVAKTKSFSMQQMMMTKTEKKIMQDVYLTMLQNDSSLKDLKSYF